MFQMHLSVQISISVSLLFHCSFVQSLCFMQSSSPRTPRSPCSPRDTCKVTRSFSSRPEIQGGQGNKEHSEKMLLNLEEVKVNRKRNMLTVLFHHFKVVWDAVNHLNLFQAHGCCF